MMKTALIVASFVALALARPEPPSQYGTPQVQTSSSYGPPAPEYGVPAHTPQVYRHVYVHSAPDEPTDSQSRVIRVPGGDDKHVNIIFVKAPSSSSHQQTEVILPEQGEQKTVVYVLVKKGDHSNDVKVRAPATRGPSKPEVFFIRYKNNETGGYGPPATPPAQQYGVAAAPAPVPSQQYGTY